MLSSINTGNQSGSALVAVAALLMLLGVFLSLGIDSFKIKTPQDRAFETLKKMEIITRQLSSFAQANNRLPCPANAALGYNSAAYGDPAPNNSPVCASQFGDVPVRALNLPESFMLDAWGRKFRYAVSPFANNPAANTTVDAYCRVNEEWILGEVATCATKYNINPAKARFCCPGDTTALPTGNDIRIRRKDGTFIGRTRVNTFAAAVDTPATLPLPTRSTPHQIESVAYALISFGSNGGEADAVFGDEAENADNDIDFVDRYRNLTDGATFFDDIILYRTQFQVMAETNSGSCTRPYQGVTPDRLCP